MAWAKALSGYRDARGVTCRARLEKQAQRPGPVESQALWRVRPSGEPGPVESQALRRARPCEESGPAESQEGQMRSLPFEMVVLEPASGGSHQPATMSTTPYELGGDYLAPL